MSDRLLDKLDTTQVRNRVVLPPPPPASVTGFLGRLSLFHGVPFAYLVPDERLLPPESLKLFLIDPRWIDALVGGALSVGRGGMTRLLLNKTQAGNFAAEIRRAARAARSDRGTTPPKAADNDPRPADATPSYAFSGFLLRSRILEAWPGLEVRAYRSAGRTTDDALAMLRLDRVAPDVLLGVVDGQVGEFEISQPPEGLHFEAGAPSFRGDAAKTRVLDIARWGAVEGAAALAEAKMSRPRRFVFRIAA